MKRFRAIFEEVKHKMGTGRREPAEPQPTNYNLEPVVIKGLRWEIIIYGEVLTIGCRTYTFDEWWNMSDNSIEYMAFGGSVWWHFNKNWIFSLIKAARLWCPPVIKEKEPEKPKDQFCVWL